MAHKLFALAAAAALLVCAAVATAQEEQEDAEIDEVDAAPQVYLDYITLAGTALSSGINTFKGIPFAAPPVGELRWKAPQPPVNVSGVFQATKFGNACMGGGSPQSEDCLFVNVWTPATATPQSKLPVFLWIYGGAFIGGASNSFDGEPVVRGMNNEVIFASLNYRIGLFGWFQNAAQLAEGDGANFGFQDQLAALKWVNSYISAFGGDPKNVTLYGQSAGSMSTAMLLLANGGQQTLFQHAISESGAFCSSKDVMNVTLQNQFTNTLAKAANCQGSTGQALMKCLRAASATTLQNAAGSLPWRPTVDGVLFKDTPWKLLAQGQVSHIPHLSGTNTNEGTVFAMSVQQQSDIPNFLYSSAPALSAENVSTLLTLYPESGFTSALLRAAEMFGDATFICPSEQLAAVRNQLGYPMYRYRFDHLPENGGGSQFGVMHGAEIPFVFNESSQLAPDEQPLSAAMMQAWKALGLSGNPSTASFKWPLYTETQQQTIIQKSFGVETDGAYMPGHAERCKFWQAFDQQWDVSVFLPSQEETVVAAEAPAMSPHQMKELEEKQQMEKKQKKTHKKRLPRRH